MKVTAPLFSLSARGHLGDVLTAYRHSGSSYIIEKRKRRGLFVRHCGGYGCSEYGGSEYGSLAMFFFSRGSDKQDLHRKNFALVWKSYALLTPTEKALLSEEARSLHMTGANLFMSRWL